MNCFWQAIHSLNKQDLLRRNYQASTALISVHLDSQQVESPTYTHSASSSAKTTAIKMPFTMYSLATAVLLLAGQAMAHMMMNHPVPFGNATLNTSPLNPVKPGTDGSDYPCKQRTGVYDITLMNNMAVNDEIALNFTGSASHGGGTCQIAVTLDKEPTVSSIFKIIKVYEGGCPTSGDGNDGSDNDFLFTIPTGFPSGQASLAWVWYNKIGNREVYMNCAPITVTGGSESKDVFDSLPNLYLINLPATECGTQDTSDVVVPDPGKDVVTGALATFKSPTGSSCAASAAAQTSGLTGYQTASTGNSTTQAASLTVNYGGTSSMITISTAAPAYFTAAATSDSTDAPASYPTLTASSGAGIYGSGTATGTGAASAATGSSSTDSTCSTNGALLCNGSSQFGLCDNGNVVWQTVAAGTTCSNGQIQKRSALRHAHVRRQAQNGDFRHGA